MIHSPYKGNEPFAIFFSWCFWIVNIAQIGTGILVVFYDDMGWFVPEAMRQLAGINVGIGGGIIIGRLIYFVLDEMNAHITSKENKE